MLHFTCDSLNTQERLQISALGAVVHSPSLNRNEHTRRGKSMQMAEKTAWCWRNVLESNKIFWEILLVLPMEFSKISSRFRSQRRPDIALVSAESCWAFFLWYLIELVCFKRQSLRVVSLSRGWMLTRTGFHCNEGAAHLLPHGNLKSKLQDLSCTLKSGYSTSRIHTEMLLLNPKPTTGIMQIS